MKSGYKLYGHPSLTKVSNITIAAGSKNVHLEDLVPMNLLLQSGDVIAGCVFKSIRFTSITGTNIMFEKQRLINIVHSDILIDCSSSGYIRNNKIIRHQVQTDKINLIMKGNSTTPSYGNVHFQSNFLTPHGETTDLDGLQSATFVGIDAEGWNMKGLSTKEMFVAKNIGVLKITNFSGDNGYSQVKTGAYNIDADNLFILNKTVGANSISKISLKTNAFIAGSTEPAPRIDGVATGFDVLAHINSTETVLSALATTAKLSQSILGPKYTPWNRPVWETLPSPLGANWKTDRVGKADQREYIQNLINTKGVAELPEGIFYIGSTLNIHLDGTQGIVGRGTGKTVIVGLTDDFPLLTLDKGTDSNFTLAYLTLQGGSVGLYAGNINGVGIGQIAYQKLKYIVFRDQNYGIQLSQITGIDNNFFEYLGFVNCKIGFFQDPLSVYIDYKTSSYVDKTMFYQCQFINNTTAFSMMATRANNLNTWLNCKFDGGDSAFILGGQNNTIIANSDFTNYKGANVISTNSISLYNDNFYGNSVSSATIKSAITYLEGCNLLDNSNVFSPLLYNPISGLIFNSKVTGNALTIIPPNKGYGGASLVLSNSSLLANPTVSKLLVNVKNGVPTVIINSPPNPYPQLLVTQ